MRTTVTLEPEVEALIRRRMQERGVSFKRALNDALRESLAPSTGRPFATEPADLGTPVVSLDRALQVAAELEDEDLTRKLRAGK